jgi:hypothetical protein
MATLLSEEDIQEDEQSPTKRSALPDCIDDSIDPTTDKPYTYPEHPKLMSNEMHDFDNPSLC